LKRARRRFLQSKQVLRVFLSPRTPLLIRLGDGYKWLLSFYKFDFPESILHDRLLSILSVQIFLILVLIVFLWRLDLLEHLSDDSDCVIVSEDSRSVTPR